MDNLEVKIIGEVTDSFGDVLGISRDRWAELTPFMKDAVETKGTVLEAIAATSKYVTHPNELVMVTLTLQALVNKMHENPLHNLLSFLSSVKKH